MALSNQPWTTFSSFLTTEPYVSGTPTAEQTRILDLLEFIIDDSDIGLGAGDNYDDFGTFLKLVRTHHVTQFFSNSPQVQFHHYTTDIIPDLAAEINAIADDIYLRETNIASDTENNLDAWDSFFAAFPEDINQGIQEFVKGLRSPNGNPTVIQLKDLTGLSGAGSINVVNELLKLETTHSLVIALANRFLSSCQSFYETITSNWQFDLKLKYDNDQPVAGEELTVTINYLTINGTQESAGSFEIGKYTTDENGFIKLRYPIVQENEDHFPSDIALDFSHSTLTLNPSQEVIPTKLIGSGGSLDGPKELRIIKAGAEPTSSPNEVSIDATVTAIWGAGEIDARVNLRTFINGINEDNNGYSGDINFTGNDSDLSDIRRIGGLQNTLEYLELSDSAEDETKKEFIRILDRHAYLDGIGVDSIVAKALVPGVESAGFSLDGIAKLNRNEAVEKIATASNQNDFTAYAQNNGITSAVNYSASFVAGQHARTAMKPQTSTTNTGTQTIDNPAIQLRIQTLLSRIYRERCNSEDCETAVSPLAYLLDLLHYSVSNVTQGAVGSKTHISLSELSNRFFQDFEDLPAACDSVDESVSQARLSVEALRKKGTNSAEYPEYLEEVYQGLLRLLGTSKLELFDARDNIDRKKRLCEKLGFAYDPSFDIISKLYLEDGAGGDNELNEKNLERLTGLKNTQVTAEINNPFSKGMKESGDPNNYLSQWKFENLIYGVNTNTDGTIKVDLTVDTQTNLRKLEVFLGTTKVGEGEITNASGTGFVSIIPEGVNGISGTVFLKAAANDALGIQFQVLPQILAAQFAGLINSWAEQDLNDDPVIDPDLLFPEDFADPFDSDNNSPVGIWKSRKGSVSSLKLSMSEGSGTQKSASTFVLRRRELDESETTIPVPDVNGFHSSTTDANGNFYLAGSDKVLVLDSDRYLIDTWDVNKSAEMNFSALKDISYSSEFDLLVLADDTSSHSIIKGFSPSGQLKLKFQLSGSQEGLLNSLNQAAFLKSGELLVADQGEIGGSGSHSRLQSFQNPIEIEQNREYGNEGEGKDRALPIEAIDEDGDRAIAISYSLDNSYFIKIYDLENPRKGDFVYQKDEYPVTKIAGYMHPTDGYKTFSSITDIAYGQNGILFVLDGESKLVILFSKKLEFIGSHKLDDNLIPQGLAPSMKSGVSEFFVTYEGQATLDQFTFTIDDGFSVGSNPTSLTLSGTDHAGKMVCKENGDLFVTMVSSVEMVANGQTLSTPHYTSSNMSNLKWVKLALNAQGDYNGLVISSLTGGIEQIDDSNPTPVLQRSWYSKNAWLNFTDTLSIGHYKNGRLLIANDQGQILEFGTPSVVWNKTGESIKEIIAPRSGHLLAGTDAEVYVLNTGDWSEENALASETSSISSLNTLSIGQDEFKNIFVLSGVDLHRFNKEYSFLESDDLSGVDFSLSNTVCFQTVPGRRGLVLHSGNPGTISYLSLKTQLEQLIDSFNSANGLAKQPLLFDDIVLLNNKENEGYNIQEDLIQSSLSFSEFRYLKATLQREYERKALPSGSDWWDQAKDILINVYKKEKATDWKQDEEDQGITLSPFHFRPLSSLQESELSFNRWRASVISRQEHRDKISSRTVQLSTLFDSSVSMLEDLEKDHMTKLRDLVIEAHTGEDSLSLENSLLMDMHSLGEVRTNRIAQATTTLQGLLWGVRNQTYENTHNYNVNSDFFDDEWQWLGTYASWRAAMMIFLYPENLLAPQYKRDFSEKFREITNEVLRTRRFSQKDACKLENEYSQYLGDLSGLVSLGGVLINAQEKIEKNDCNEYYSDPELKTLAIAEKNGRRYFSLQDPEFGNEEFDPRSIWKELPEISRGLFYLGYFVDSNDPRKEEVVFLFRTDDVNELFGLSFYPRGCTWGNELIKLPNPDFDNTDVKFSYYGEYLHYLYADRSIFRYYKIGDKTTGNPWENSKSFILHRYSSTGQFYWKEIFWTRGRNASFSNADENYQNDKPTHVVRSRGWSSYTFISVKKSGGITGVSTGVNKYDQGNYYNFSFEKKGAVGKGVSFIDVSKLLIPLSNEGDDFSDDIVIDFANLDSVNAKIPVTYHVNSLPFMWWHHSVVNYSGRSEYNHDNWLFHHGNLRLAKFELNNNVPEETASKYISPRAIFDLGLRASPISKPRMDLQSLQNSTPVEHFYYDEAYLHFPLLMAEKLRDSGNFEHSLKWYAQIYDFNRSENREIYQGLKNSVAFSSFSKNQDWLKDPLHPHALGSTRYMAYQTYIVNGISQCLIAYADSEFTKDTAESIAKARELYKEALEALKTFQDVKTQSDCEVKISALSITVPVGGEKWQSLVDAGIKTLGSIKLCERLDSYIATEFGTEKTAIEGAVDGQGDVDEDALQSACASFIQSVLDAVHDQNGIQRFSFNQIHSKARQAGDAVRMAGASATDGEDHSRTIHSQGVQRTTKAVKYKVGIADEYLGTNPTSGTADWLRKETIHIVDSPDYELPVIKLAEGADMDEEFYDTRVLGTDDSGLNSNDVDLTNNTAGTIRSSTPIQGPEFSGISKFVFGIPKNPLASYLALKAQLNLSKIYSGRNISGYERPLEPFSAPINATSGIPGLATNGGVDINDLGVLPGIYRFSYLLARAKEQANYAGQMENQFLSLLEKYDAESFSILQAEQSLNLSTENIRLQDIRLKEAKEGVKLSSLQLSRSQISLEHYTGLLDQGWLQTEIDSIKALEIAQGFTRSATEYLASGAILSGLGGNPNGNPMYWASVAGGVASGIGIGYQGAASIQQMNASILAQRASYERRAQEWEFQESLAQQDVKIGQQNIKISELRVDQSAQEKKITELQKQYAQENLDFLKNKFTSAELYSWMAGVMEGVYSYFLAQATATAKMAYYQLGFERQQVPTTTIREDYWTDGADGNGLLAGLQEDGESTDRKGLTGTARLSRDIIQLEQEALETDKRKLQITKSISLATHDPSSFAEFRNTGVLYFGTPMEIFDRDFPGHYLRLIKRVSVSVIALVPTVEGIKASLSNSGTSKVVKGTIKPTKVDIDRLPEKISFSNAVEATGVFDLNPVNEMLNPFEGMGVESGWIFEMQKPSNFIDYNGIADIILTIDYTALDNPDYRTTVIGDLGTVFDGERPFSFRNNFPDQWFDLNNAELLDQSDQFKVSLDLTPVDFPANLANPRIEQITMIFDIEGLDQEPVQVEVSVNDRTCTTVEGRISTRSTTGNNWISLANSIGQGVHWNMEIGKVFVNGNLELGDTEKRSFFRDRVNDIYLILSYKGQTSPWKV